MPPSRPLKRSRPRRVDLSDDSHSRPVRRRRIDRDGSSVDIGGTMASQTVKAGSMVRSKMNENGFERRRREMKKKIRARLMGDRDRAGPITTPSRRVHDKLETNDNGQDDDDDDGMQADELELTGLEANLLPLTGSPAANEDVSSGSSLTKTQIPSGVPSQLTFPLGPLLDGFQWVSSGTRNNSSLAYPTEFKPRSYINNSNGTGTTPKLYLHHRRTTSIHPRISPIDHHHHHHHHHASTSSSFSTPRKISHTSSLSSSSSSGSDTTRTDLDSPLLGSSDLDEGDETEHEDEDEDEEDLSGAECESRVLDEIERENKRFYYGTTMRGVGQQEEEDGEEEVREVERGMKVGQGKDKSKCKARADMRTGLGPTVSDVTSCLKMLGSPIHIRSTPDRPARTYPSGSSPSYSSSSSPRSSPSTPESLGREEAEAIEAELFATSEMAVDGSSERGDCEEERMVSVLTTAGVSDSEDEGRVSNAEDMELPLADIVRITHQSRMTTYYLPTSESFGGGRVRRLARARSLGQVVEELGRPMSLSFARLVAVKRRGGFGAAKLFAGKTVRQDLLASRYAPGTILTGSGGDIELVREAMRRSAERRSLLARSRMRAEVNGINAVWAKESLDRWWMTLGRVEPFRSFMLYVQSDAMVRALRSLEREMAEEDEERHVDVIFPLDGMDVSSAGPSTPSEIDFIPHSPASADDTTVVPSPSPRRRVYHDERHLANHEALYPEFIERYVSRLSETEPRFQQLRAWQAIDATWEARFAAQEERESRRVAEHKRRAAERARQREEADRRSREARHVEEQEALMRAVQIAQWEAEAEQERQRIARQEAERRRVEEIALRTAVRADVARDIDIMRHPDPPTYPEHREAITAIPTTLATLPVTPPPSAPMELPDYSRIVYGNRSPPPPPPYNAVSGYELVEIDDLLFDDDDDEEEEDDIEDDLGPVRGNWQDEQVDQPITGASFVGSRVLSMEELHAEQERRDQAEIDQTEVVAEQTNGRGRCVIM